MFLNEPGRTNYDLNFNLFGFPIRVHPAFFILPVLFGASAGSGPKILVFAVVFFISILIHELGHALAMRYFRSPARIVLYMMGGLAIPDSGNPWESRTRQFSSQQQVLVSFAGPLAGFVLAVVIALIIFAIKGTITFQMVGPLPLFLANFSDASINSPLLQFALAVGLLVNIYLNILNLAPVLPLDGGQIMRELLMQKNSANGMRYALIVSIVAGIAIGLFGITNGQTFLGIFFGFMAWNNWQSLQQISGGGFGGGNRGRGRPW